MTLLAVGSIAFDDLETPAGVRNDLLGGSATYFSLCASNFCPVRLVAVVGEDFGEAQEAAYRGRPIDLDGVIRRKGRSFHWKGRYGHDLNEAQTLKTELNVFADFAPELPGHYKNSPFLFLGNIDPRLQLQVVGQMSPRPKWVALDTMNFWIDGSRGELEKALKATDILLINEAEAKSLAGETNAVKAGEVITSMGPRIVVVKRGEYGALLVAPGLRVPVPAMPMDSVTDPTGAGDTFAGGFLGYLASAGDLEEQTLRKAMCIGTVMASFTIEKFGVERIASVAKADIEERLKLFSRATGVQGLQ